MSEKTAEDLTDIPGNPWEKVLEREKKQMTDDFSMCLLGDFGKGLKSETQVAVGSAHKEIVGVAKEKNASMIVMATHGRTGFSRALIGSVTEKVVRNAPCPVFTVTPKEIRLG